MAGAEGTAAKPLLSSHELTSEPLPPDSTTTSKEPTASCNSTWTPAPSGVCLTAPPPPLTATRQTPTPYCGTVAPSRLLNRGCDPTEMESGTAGSGTTQAN